jgi:hypothetical protein
VHLNPEKSKAIMNMLTAQEYAAYLAIPKPCGGEPGSPEDIELQKWHYAQLREGIELMRAGAFGTTQERIQQYVEANLETMELIEAKLAKWGAREEGGANRNV